MTGASWITWAGGDCPVPYGARVEIRARDGATEVGWASEFSWRHVAADPDLDIMAYRVIA